MSRHVIKPFEQPHFTNPTCISLFSHGLDKNSEVFKYDLRPFTHELALNTKFQDLMLHWKKGIKISDTSLVDFMLMRIKENGGEYKGLKTKSDVTNYYRELDLIYESVRQNGLIIPPASNFFSWGSFNMNGIVLNIDYEGNLIFAGRGTHRLAMAKCALLPLIPFYIRKIHASSIRTGSWKKNLLSPGLRLKANE